MSYAYGTRELIDKEKQDMRRLKYKPQYEAIYNPILAGVADRWQVTRLTIKMVKGKKKVGHSNKIVASFTSNFNAEQVAQELNNSAKETFR